MIVTCDYCGKQFNKRKSAIRKQNYCCKEHRHKAKYVMLKCDTCGKTFERLRVSYKDGKCFCSIKCAKIFTSLRMTEYNEKHNPTSMTLERKEHLSQSRRKSSEERSSYEKYHGRHLHRVIMEHIIGRELLPTEVVHHIDGNKQNNSPENLQLFSSKAEHSRFHKLKSLGRI